MFRSVIPSPTVSPTINFIVLITFSWCAYIFYRLFFLSWRALRIVNLINHYRRCWSINEQIVWTWTNREPNNPLSKMLKYQLTYFNFGLLSSRLVHLHTICSHFFKIKIIFSVHMRELGKRKSVNVNESWTFLTITVKNFG